MKKLIIIFLALIIQFISVKAFNYEVSYTTGAFMGTPFWNSENLSGEDSIQADQDYMRFYNRLRLKSEIIKDLNFQVNAVRSDNISGDNSASETKLFEVYAKYDIGHGHFKLGRFSEFNKWTIGSIDGASISYELMNNFVVNAYGGMEVWYGKIYDSEHQHLHVYGDLEYKGKGLGGKVKYMHTDEFDVAGAEMYSRLGTFAFSANGGYNFTESLIHDAGLSVTGSLTKDLRLFGHYHLMRPNNIWGTYTMPELYQNLNFGLSYKLPLNMNISGIQAMTMTDSNSTYITNVSLNHKYFTVGFNYLTGDLYYNRFSVSLGGRYSPVKDLNLSVGIATVDYMINSWNYNESSLLWGKTDKKYFALSSYLRASYKFLDNFIISAYGNYYHTDSDYVDNIRGGATLTFNFGGGK